MNELIESGSHMVSLVGTTDLGELIQPLIKEIHLFDTFVAGTTHLRDQTVLERIETGQELILRRENNKFDSNAVMILTLGEERVGYIPEKDNIIFARLMDAGKLLKGKINGITKKGSFTQISLGVYLVDY